MPTLDKEDPSKIYALFKGEPGTWKSTHALTFPTPQYWFNWDRKMGAMLVPARKWGLDTSKIESDDYEDWTTAENKLKTFQLNCPYNTLVFDSLTSMADMTLRQTLLKKGTQRQIAGIRVNEQEDFNAESGALNNLISMTKDIQSFNYKRGKMINIILIAHIMDVTQPEAGRIVHVRTIVTAGKRVAAKVPAYCSEVYHFNIEPSVVEGGEGTRVLYTENTGRDFARTALDLPKKIILTDKQLYKDYVKPAIDKLKG